MANILERYGIKEVADVVFYEIDDTGKPGAPVLYLDTLKVSTTEQTAENTSARGGKGNPELIMWDYNKEITVNLEDALFSMRSLAVMYGSEVASQTEVMKTVFVKDIVDGKVSTQAGDIVVADCNPAYYTVDGKPSTAGAEDAMYVTLTVKVNGQEIAITPQAFPKTYYVTGDTYARSDINGEDEMFQFIIPKAKVLSEVTLTMEAEGDPSTFSMNLKVLRSAEGQMMKLVKYKLGAPEDEGENA